MKKILASLLVLSQASSAFALTDIGVASAVRGAVQAMAPGAAGRVVETGKPVYSHDKISTGPEGKLQILLLDETSFTIGPNSEMELDEFVYDPATSAGKVSAKIAKGAFRFVTGKVARRDPGKMQVAMPVGTIGIRGTMTAGKVGADEATVVLLGPGPENNADEKRGGITVGNDKGSVDIDKDGYGVTIRKDGPPSDPFKLDQKQIDGILSGVASAPSGDSKDEGMKDQAGQSSGQDTATGKDTAGDAFAILESAQGETSQFASQQFTGSSRATWDDVRSIPGGTGKYSGSAPYYNCTGGTCQSVSAGTASFAIDIDFGARTLGGGSSNITMAGAFSTTGNVNSLSFATLGGDAKSNLSVTGAGTWTGTTIELLNSGGVPAASATVDIKVFDGSTSQTYQGTVTGTR